jgi:zinc protease
MPRKNSGKPQAVNTNSIPGADDVLRFVLPNGIVVLARSNFHSPSITVSGYVTTGALFDPDEKLGLADFASAMLMRGNAQRDFQKIYDALESCGASLGFSGGTHNTGFHSRALAEDLPLLLELLSDSLRQPTFPAEQVERLRAQLLTGLALRAQDTGDMASLTFDEIIFAGHPYRRPEDGYPETVKAVTRDDIAGYHRKYFGPRGMVISIVGAVEKQAAVDLIGKFLGDWQNPDQPDQPPLPPLQPLAATIKKHIAIAGKSQADIVLGVSGPTRKAPEYTAASLGNSILGQFGMMGRIGDVVREKSGLAYYAHSSLSAGVGPGSWEISAGVNPVNVEKAITLIIHELADFVKDGVTQQELDDSQANFIGRLPLTLESNAGVSGSLLNIERFDLGLDYYRRYAGMIQSATRDQIVDAARKYIDPDRLAIATAGP